MTQYRTALLLRQAGVAAGLGALLLAAGCARNTTDADVKPIGVGFDPGDLFAGPEPRGGIVDLTLAQMRGTNLDLGVTGFFGSAGSLTDPVSDPFNSILAFSYFFSPAITAADEYQLVSPKGPDVLDACLVSVNNRGPLGSFRTVDVGDRMLFTNAAEDPAERTEFIMARNPQNYPLNTSSVFIYYIGTQPLLLGHELLPDNWAYDEELLMHFEGGLPPAGTPVASIPRPSDAADERVGKEAGDPRVRTPEDISGVLVANLSDFTDAVPMRYDPTAAGLPDPRDGEGVIAVRWDAADGEHDGVVTIGLKLLGAPEPYLIDDERFCTPAEVLEGDQDLDWLDSYEEAKDRWCDPGFEPDPNLGNDEFGGYLSATDNCHDGIDNNGDGRCDEGGCLAADGETLLSPDANCARHIYKTAECGSDNHCRNIGGERGGDGHMGDLLCTATDDGEFIVDRDTVQSLFNSVDIGAAEGAVFVFGRTNEELITVPMVRDQIGNEDDINPVRLRASQVQFGRFAWE